MGWWPRSFSNLTIVAGPVALFTILFAQAFAHDDSTASYSSDNLEAVYGTRIQGEAVGGGAQLRSSLGGSTTVCILDPGQTAVLGRFQSGFYRVISASTCPQALEQALWVWANEMLIAPGQYVGLKEVRPNSAINVAMNYATNQIFCTYGQCLIRDPLYAQNRCFLEPKVADKLQNAAVIAQRWLGKSVKLRLLDCYRPVYVQERMFELVPNRAWVAKPDRIAGRFSRHNSGSAVDLTIEHNGMPLDMGSGFDEFTARSTFSWPGQSASAARNRELLRRIMRHADFSPYEGEWWHFEGAGGARIGRDLPL